MEEKPQSSALVQPRLELDKNLILPSLEEMLLAGVHFGHQKRRWHPRIAAYLYPAPGKIHVFDLAQTREKLAQAAAFLEEMAQAGSPIVFVGTKRQAAEILKTQALSCGAYFVNRRWLGGTITNYDSVHQKLTRLKKIEDGLKEGGLYSGYTKKEKLDLSRELAKLEEEVGGLKGLNGLPKALFVVDVKREATAVAEARKKGIPVVAVVDSNCSPDRINFPIPGNDDSARSIELILKTVASAVSLGRQAYLQGKAKEEEKAQKEARPKKTETVKVAKATKAVKKAKAAAVKKPSRVTKKKGKSKTA